MGILVQYLSARGSVPPSGGPSFPQGFSLIQFFVLLSPLACSLELCEALFSHCCFGTIGYVLLEGLQLQINII